MCPEELVALISSLAISISCGRTADDVAWIAAILVQLGDTLATIAVQKERLEACCEKKDVDNETL